MINKELFEKKINKTDGCWEWKAAKDKDGYGFFSVDREIRYAHRIAYMLYVGEITNGLHVCHKCDNPSCVNPDHLFLSTHRGNMEDRKNKGRYQSQKGELNNSAKITKQISDAIKSMKLSQRKIARLFGISKSQVGNIKRGNNWNE